MKKIIEQKTKIWQKRPKACIQRNHKCLILAADRKDRQSDDTRSEGRRITRPEIQSKILVQRRSPKIDPEDYPILIQSLDLNQKH